MMLKTSLLNRIGSSFPLSHLDSFDGTSFTFTCNCGSTFLLNKKGNYVSDHQFSCSNCKRLSRLAPHIGERYVYRRIHADARHAKREFAIGFDWFVEKCHEDCYYCGRSNINSSTVPSKKQGEVLLKDFRYNGLDRIHNEVGYVEWNCVPCCIICNRAKNSLPLADFLEWIETMVNYRKSLIAV